MHCEFGTFLDDLLRDRLVCRVLDKEVQHCFLQESELTYKQAFVTGSGKTLRNGSACDSRNARFSSSGRNLSKSRFCHISVEQPF